MKQNNIKILFILPILLSAFAFASTAYASGNSLYVSPATTTVNAGNNIIISAIAGTLGDKICAVQGTIVFNNLTCQSITVASGLMAQTQPTCSSPSFVIGIPKCTTANMTMFTVSAKAGVVGAASVSFSKVNLVGVGASAGSASLAGNYTVTAVPVVQKQTTTVKPTTQTAGTTTVTQTVAPSSNAQEANTNQTASIAGAGASMGFFGWIWSNIIWIIVLVIFTAVAYFAGRISCKKNKKV